MNISDYFYNPQKKQNIEYFINLVRIAKADDNVSNSELELLHRIGRKTGLTDPEIDKLINSTDKSDYIPPYELSKRFDQVYEVIRMTLADGKVETNEMRLAESFAVKSGFTESDIPDLLELLITGIKEGKDEEDLFEAWKKERQF